MSRSDDPTATERAVGYAESDLLSDQLVEPARAGAPTAWLAAEFAVVFGGTPAALTLGGVAHWMFPVLFAITLAALVYLLSDRSFDRRSFWRSGALRTDGRRLLGTTAFGLIGLVVLMGGLVTADAQGWTDLPTQVRWLSLPTSRPQLWILIMVLYPLLSVYPQELVYRAFFFRRYAPLFRGDVAMRLASALAFAWAHIVFENVLAIALCLVGGLLFATTYQRTRSLLAASLEHAAYGCAIFTIGLGWYFYGGALR